MGKGGAFASEGKAALSCYHLCAKNAKGTKIAKKTRFEFFLLALLAPLAFLAQESDVVRGLELTSMEQELRNAVREAAGRPEVSEAVGRIYSELQVEIDRRKPVCVVSGRCCRFEEYGHRLYVTTLELAAFMRGLSDLSKKRAEPSSLSANPGGCPFQIKKLCGVHAIRPFGCRVFFCDETATDWQHEQYEKFHAQVRLLHEELGVPYYYLEWRAALEALDLRRSS